ARGAEDESGAEKDESDRLRGEIRAVVRHEHAEPLLEERERGDEEEGEPPEDEHRADGGSPLAAVVREPGDGEPAEHRQREGGHEEQPRVRGDGEDRQPREPLARSPEPKRERQARECEPDEETPASPARRPDGGERGDERRETDVSAADLEEVVGPDQPQPREPPGTRPGDPRE